MVWGTELTEAHELGKQRPETKTLPKALPGKNPWRVSKGGVGRGVGEDRWPG